MSSQEDGLLGKLQDRASELENEVESAKFDETKLKVLWKRSALALSVVGEGFETVVRSIDELIADNQKGLISNQRTRIVVYVGVCFLVLSSVYSLGYLAWVLDSQKEAMEALKSQAAKIQEEAQLVSKMQAMTIEMQLAIRKTEEAPFDLKERAKTEALLSEVENKALTNRIRLAETSQEAAELKKQVAENQEDSK